MIFLKIKLENLEQLKIFIELCEDSAGFFTFATYFPCFSSVGLESYICRLLNIMFFYWTLFRTPCHVYLCFLGFSLCCDSFSAPPCF